VLQGVALGIDSGLSTSHCAGRLWIVDGAGSLWRGYDICTSPERATLSHPVRLGGGQFQLQLHASPTRNYVTERTANFTTWVPVVTNLMLAPNATILDAGAAGSNFFYRARTP